LRNIPLLETLIEDHGLLIFLTGKPMGQRGVFQLKKQREGGKQKARQ